MLHSRTLIHYYLRHLLTLLRDHSGSITRSVHLEQPPPLTAHWWEPPELNPCPETLTICNKSKSFITHSGFTQRPFIISFIPPESVWLSPALFSLSLCEHWKKKVFTFLEVLSIPVITVSLSLPWPLQWHFQQLYSQHLVAISCAILASFFLFYFCYYFLLCSFMLSCIDPWP